MPKVPDVYVKYDRKTGEIRCSCGGEAWCGGTFKQRVPVGFGDLSQVSDKSGFGVSTYGIKGFYGTCMKCGATVYAVDGKRGKVTHRKIKLEGA